MGIITMQIKVEILSYPKMWLPYCTNKSIILFRLIFFYDHSAHESALKMQFRAFTRQTCDLNKYSCVGLSCVGESSEFSVNMSPVVDQEAYGADRSQLNFC